MVECLLGAGANPDRQKTVRAIDFSIGVHTLSAINLCFRFLCMQDTTCKTGREVVPTPRKRSYTLHEISAQEYYCARGSAGQYCRYPGISWYPVSIVMPICTVSSIKTRVVYYFWGIKGQKDMTQSNKKSADVSTQHVCNTNCNVELSDVFVSCCQYVYYIVISWYTNFSRYCPALARGSTSSLYMKPDHANCTGQTVIVVCTR